MNERDALTAIAKLCDETIWILNARDVRAILARVGSGAVPPQHIDSEQVARRFHEAYERLAPSFGYETRRESAVPWEDVPEQNKRLMIAVADAVLALVRPVEGVVLEANEHGKVHVENGWRIRRTYVVGEPGELVERLGVSS